MAVDHTAILLKPISELRNSPRIMVRKACVIIVLATFSILAIVFLHWTNDMPGEKSYDFLRMFPKANLAIQNVLELHGYSFYIAGSSQKSLYLGNTSAPWQLLTIDLSTFQQNDRTIKTTDERKANATHISVEPPDFYLFDLIYYASFTGELSNLLVKDHLNDSTKFVEAIPLNKNSFVVRTMKSDCVEFVLAKKSKCSPNFISAPDLLERQIDGLFCVDGMMNYNKESNVVIYVYYYRNQFICMDTSLNLIYRAKTVDPIEKAQIKVSEVNSEKAHKLSSPPFVVNRQISMTARYLFVNSGVMSHSENKKTFHESSVIDVYSLKNGAYQYSFYVPNYKNHPMRAFKVLDNNALIALHANFLITYKVE